MPDDLIEEFPDLLEKGIAERKKSMQDVVKQHFRCKKEPELHFMIEKGQATKLFMKFIENLNIDLVMVGRKKDKPGGGVKVRRLARRAGCSILIVPEKVGNKVEKILVPIDFSDYSASAIERAVEIAVSNNGPVDNCSECLLCAIWL